MAVNVSVQHNGGFLPGSILPSGNPFKCHEEVLYLQSMIPPEMFEIFSSDWRMLRRSRCVQICI